MKEAEPGEKAAAAGCKKKIHSSYSSLLGLFSKLADEAPDDRAFIA